MWFDDNADDGTIGCTDLPLVHTEADMPENGTELGPTKYPEILLILYSSHIKTNDHNMPKIHEHLMKSAKVCLMENEHIEVIAWRRNTESRRHGLHVRLLRSMCVAVLCAAVFGVSTWDLHTLSIAACW